MPPGSDTAQWLRDRLAAGPAESAALKAEASAIGVGPKVLRLARQKLGLVVTRSGCGLTMRSTWSLPSASERSTTQPGSAAASVDGTGASAAKVPTCESQPDLGDLSTGEVKWRDRRLAYFESKGIDRASSEQVAMILVARDRRRRVDTEALHIGSCAECQCLEGDSCEPGRNGNADGPRPLTEVWLCWCARRPV